MSDQTRALSNRVTSRQHHHWVLVPPLPRFPPGYLYNISTAWTRPVVSTSFIARFLQTVSDDGVPWDSYAPRTSYTTGIGDVRRSTSSRIAAVFTVFPRHAFLNAILRLPLKRHFISPNFTHRNAHTWRNFPSVLGSLSRPTVLDTLLLSIPGAIQFTSISTDKF